MGTTDDPTSPCLDETDSEGMQNCYLVLSEEERAKGFVRPVCQRYVHARDLGGCGGVTWMALAIAETYARNPSFYGSTWCGRCAGHHPVGENGQFYWWSDRENGSTGEKVGV